MTGPEWEDPRRVLARHGLLPKRAYSQNFITARSVVERIVAALTPRPGQIVVELGPGVGTLTAALLRAQARVIGIEQDPRMIDLLTEEFATHGDLRLVRADAAHVSLAPFCDESGAPNPVVGNLPYAASGAIFRSLVEQSDRVHRAVVMVQREVADRLVAIPNAKAYGALSVFVQSRYTVGKCFHVSPGAFHPPPKVTSTVVRLEPRAHDPVVSTPAFSAAVRGAFGTRRKTLRNALKAAMPGRAAWVEAVLSEAGLDPERRAQTLQLEEFVALATAWCNHQD